MIRDVFSAMLTALYKAVAILRKWLKHNNPPTFESVKMPPNKPKSREITSASREWRKMWRTANPDKIRAHIERFYSKYPNYAHEYQVAHREQINKYNREYRKAHKDENIARNRAYNRAWNNANTDKRKEYNKKSYRKRRLIKQFALIG